MLLASGRFAVARDRLDLIDEDRLMVHPWVAGHGPTLYADGLPRTRRLTRRPARPLRNAAVARHDELAG